ILALQTDEFDSIFSAMTINPEREEQIDLIPYITVGTGILVPTGNPNGIEELSDLCGLTVAVQLGTVQETLANDTSASCTEAITVVTFDTNPLAVADLRTGGADANLADFPVAYLDAQESDGDLEVLPNQIDAAPYGIGVRKESAQLRAVLEQALQAIIADGTYAAILAAWDLESTALP
ncbi:MAG: transporter substrate-binding domain-containing protein, partial [Chloroflexi bacterium]|nr:transporter substrate-binding domain-containing protein [Chloroflexota bacterium]